MFNVVHVVHVFTVVQVYHRQDPLYVLSAIRWLVHAPCASWLPHHVNHYQLQNIR